jgi:hypothetical protein
MRCPASEPVTALEALRAGSETHPSSRTRAGARACRNPSSARRASHSRYVSSAGSYTTSKSCDERRAGVRRFHRAQCSPSRTHFWAEVLQRWQGCNLLCHRHRHCIKVCERHIVSKYVDFERVDKFERDRP